MITRKHRLGSLILTASIWAAAAHAGPADGFVTPTEITMTFTALRLLGPDRDQNKNRKIVEGTYPVTFKKTDADFHAVPLTEMFIPEGRYGGVQICFNNTFSVKVDGETYHGANGAAFNNGDAIYTVGTGNGATAGALSKTGPATAVSFTSSNLGQCAETYFPGIACIASNRSQCEATDTYVDPATLANINLNILIDMRHALVLDSATGAITSNNFRPYAKIGTPGAAVHLSYSSNPGAGTSSTEADLSVLLDIDRTPIYISGVSNAGNSPGLAGYCGGVSYVSTGTSAYVNASRVDVTGAVAKLQYAASSLGTSSNGVMVIDNLFTAAGSTTTGSCVADSAATPPNLGLSYTGGSGKAGTLTWTVKRIVDPNNMTGVCSSSPCGSY